MPVQILWMIPRSKCISRITQTTSNIKSSLFLQAAKISSLLHNNINILKQFQLPKSTYPSSFHMRNWSSILWRDPTISFGTRRNAFRGVRGHQLDTLSMEYCDLTELPPFLAIRSYENPLFHELGPIQLTFTTLPSLSTSWLRVKITPSSFSWRIRYFSFISKEMTRALSKLKGVVEFACLILTWR